MSSRDERAGWTEELMTQSEKDGRELWESRILPMLNLGNINQDRTWKEPF